MQPFQPKHCYEMLPMKRYQPALQEKSMPKERLPILPMQRCEQPVEEVRWTSRSQTKSINTCKAASLAFNPAIDVESDGGSGETDFATGGASDFTETSERDKDSREVLSMTNFAIMDVDDGMSRTGTGLVACR
jgi:hypothetical protein